MKSIKLVLTAIVCQSLIGCSGHLYTVINPDLTAKNGIEKKVEGVIVYPVQDVVEVYQTTTLVDKSKKIIGTAPKVCTPKRSIKFTTRANYSNPYIIKYEAGLLETNSFGVTLKDGVLTGINTSSDPSKSASSAAELLPFVAAPKAEKFVTSGLPFCNEQNKLVGIFKAPNIRSFDEIPDK